MTSVIRDTSSSHSLLDPTGGRSIAVQVLRIQILNCGGMHDLMSYQESAFLMDSLGLYRNRVDIGRATPRAHVTLTRAYNDRDFLRSANSDVHILHHLGHADGDSLQVGVRSRLTAATVERKGQQGTLELPEILISTACEVDSRAWRTSFKAAGVKLMIAAQGEVTPANLAAFDMAFYSALLSQIRKGKTTRQRVASSFELADEYYRSIHARGAKFVKFALREL